MNNERGATQRNVSLFQGDLFDNSIKNNSNKRRKEKKKEKKKNTFFEEQPKMNKSDKDFILNYYCEQEAQEAQDGEQVAQDGEQVAQDGEQVEQKYISNTNKKDIISF